MDLVEAWAALGLPPGTDWPEVRAAYRREIRGAHPDVHGSAATARAAHLNAAFTALARARREGRLDQGAPLPSQRPTPGATWRTEPHGPVEVLEGDTIHLPLPVPEAFLAVLDACHRIGEVTYVDRSGPILEAVLQIEGAGTCSLVVTFQGRCDGTEAFCTLEAIERVARPPVHHVVDALVDALTG